MPAGLDGNPNPIRSEQRDRLLDQIVHRISTIRQSIFYVGVDGAGGTGKSTLADELVARISALGTHAVRSTTDSFHNPRSVRMRRGVDSAEGYYLESHNLDVLRTDLLEPIRAGRPFRVAHFDEPSDAEVPKVWQDPKDELVLVFDGLFLQRPELRDYWDLSIYLDADKRRQRNFDAWSSTVDPEKVVLATRRYANGWQLYLKECDPVARADCVVDNNDFESPLIID